MRILSKQSMETFKDKTEDNIILLDKPADWTSFDVVKKVRGIGRFRKTGHAGTLDPFATGLLILGTGKETRSLSAISAADKSYLATVSFGYATDTYDCTGRITEKNDLNKIDKDSVRQAAKRFLGPVEQVPPMYSAKKKSGTPLYKMARKGVHVDRKPATVYFHEICIISDSGLDCDLYIKCSKGTYIRSFANDLGQETGYLAHLKALRRLSIDAYEVDHAFSISEFESYWRSLN
jgi:tRNA pseudouridine55 synthase